MPVLWISLPEIEVDASGRPRACPYCGSGIFQRWGQVSKLVRDAQTQVVQVYRYRCETCQRTFRHYPDGMDGSLYARRLRQVAALAYSLGMSARDVVSTFAALGVSLSRMTVWREGQEVLARLEKVTGPLLRRRFVIDRLYKYPLSAAFGVVVVLDLGRDRRLVLGTLDEYNPLLVKSWIETIIPDLEIGVSLLQTGVLKGSAHCCKADGVLHADILS